MPVGITVKKAWSFTHTFTSNKPCYCFVDKLCRIRGKKYFGIASTAFGTETQNVRRVDFPSSAYFSHPGK